MLRWFQALMPREDRFFDLYNQHARKLVEGADALRELLKGGPGVLLSEAGKGGSVGAVIQAADCDFGGVGHLVHLAERAR